MLINFRQTLGPPSAERERGKGRVSVLPVPGGYKD